MQRFLKNFLLKSGLGKYFKVYGSSYHYIRLSSIYHSNIFIAVDIIYELFFIEKVFLLLRIELSIVFFLMQKNPHTYN